MKQTPQSPAQPKATDMPAHIHAEIRDVIVKGSHGDPEQDAGTDPRENNIRAVAKQLVASDEVAEVVQEIADASTEILAALSAIRAPSFEVTTFIQRVRRIVKNVQPDDADMKRMEAA